jgi:ABC-type nitrate/sulfonate/bicarbonate transport system substrate-binding protein
MTRIVSLLIGLGLLATACAPAAPSPTAAPSKPTEAPKPAAPAAAPAASPAAAAPAVPAQPAAATSAPAAAPGKLDTVTYSIPSPNGFHMPILVGVDQQVFEKRGIKVDMVASGSSGVAMTQAVLGGSLHFAPVTIATALAAQAKEPDLMMIMGQFVGVPYSIMTPPEIKSVQDLKGKTAGATALKVGGDIEAIRLMLGENGLKLEQDYTVVVSGGTAERIAALQNRSVQFEAQLEPQITQIKDMGFVELLRGSDIPALRTPVQVVLIAKKSWYQQNEDVAVRFVRGYLDTLAYIYDPKNKDDVLAVIQKEAKVEAGPANALYTRNVEQLQAYIKDCMITESAMASAVSLMKKLDIEAPDDPMRFVDMSLVQKASKL